MPATYRAQTVDKIHLGYSGTGISSYSLEIGKRLGIFRRNGLDVEVVYVNSGSLLNQALIAGTFDVSLSQGSEAMMAKMRGADMRIVAVIANRFNHVYLAAPSITSFKQLKGKKVAVSRFGSGSHFQSNLALKDGGLDPEKDVTILQIGNSGARMAAILSGAVDGTIMAADLVPKAKREGFNVLADLAATKIEYPFLSLNMIGPYIDRNLENGQGTDQKHVRVDSHAAKRPGQRQSSDPRGVENRRCRDHRLRPAAQRSSSRSPPFPDSSRHSNRHR